MNDILNNAVDRFLNNCDDFMKHFPLDGQKQVSRYYEIDCRHSHIINKLANFTKKTKECTSTDGQRIQKMLIESLDLSDRKVHITGCLLDMVEKNMLNLNMNFKEIENAKLCLIKSNKRMSKLMPDNKELGSDIIDVLNIDNSNKRPKRNIKKTTTTCIEHNTNLNNKSSSTQNIKNTTSNKKSKAQPPKKKKLVLESESSNSDSDVQPTYCVCEEISYGDMVCCDNDLCPIEWFHFGCVSISRKPKGKWYCPRCRGTNSKTMKPREVFLKELEEYNKRKEENW